VRQPTGYQLDKTLGHGAAAELCHAHREDSDLRVVLKSVASEHPSARIRREFELLRRCEGPGVVRALDLDDSAEPLVLVLEWLPGRELQQLATSESTPIERVLELAVTLSQTLERLHAARVIHGNLHPEHILVSDRLEDARLISFSLAHEFGGPQEPRPLCTLQYGSPEISGRMARGADFRSDLYSLGGVLYFAFCGRAPFEDDDPLALMHAHVARPIPSILARRSDLPPTLARIVSKLLEKDPDRRYQSAAALTTDLLECRAQLRQSGRIDDELALGSADIPKRPLLPRRLYGRETEFAELERAYRRTAAGGSECWLISGPPGIGKSALIDGLRGVLIETGGYIARGKFDLYRRDRPFHGIAAAFDHWVQQLLTESEATLSSLRESLTRELGQLASVLIDLVPDLEIVLGTRTTAPKVGPREALHQLSLAIQRLVHAVARRGHPLLLVLDDLQWADPGSLYLIEELASTRPPEAFLMVGSYREAEVVESHPLRALITRLTQWGHAPHELRLCGLSIEASTQLLRDTLSRDTSSGDSSSRDTFGSNTQNGDTREREASERREHEIQRLAEITARKTGNLPLLIQQFVYHLHALDLLRFDPGVGWVWDEARVESAQISDEAVVWMTQKLRALDDDARWLIAFISCVGDQFDADLLAQLGSRPREDVERILFGLSETGLIAPCTGGFRFSHDRVREAAQQMIDPTERAGLHLATARTLFSRLPESELEPHLFELADHLVRASLEVESEEAIQWIRVLVRAAKSGLAGGVASTAELYLERARELFERTTWADAPSLGSELFLTSAEVAVISKQVQHGLDCLQRLDDFRLNPQEQLALRVVRLRLLAIDADPGRAAAELIAGLGYYGVHWPKRPPAAWQLRLRMQRCERRLRRAQGDHVADLKQADDITNAIGALQLLTAMGGALYRYSTNLATLAIGQALELLQQVGIDPMSIPYLIAAYAVHRRSIGDHVGAKRYAESAITRAAERRDPTRDPRAEYVVHALVHPWYRPRRDSIEPLERCVEVLREVGDVEFGASATMTALRYRLLSGQSPASCRERWQTAITDRLAPKATLDALGDLIAIAEGSEPPPRREQERDSTSPNSSNELYARLSDLACEMLVHCLAGHFESAWQSFEDVAADLGRLSTGPTTADLLLLRAVAAAAVWGNPDSELRLHRGTLRKILAKARRELEQLSRSGPDFAHMLCFVEAESQALRGREEAARAHFTRAAKRAEEAGFLHHAALASERHADLLRRFRRDVEAERWYARAAEAYRAWGSEAIARRVVNRAARR